MKEQIKNPEDISSLAGESLIKQLPEEVRKEIKSLKEQIAQEEIELDKLAKEFDIEIGDDVPPRTFEEQKDPLGKQYFSHEEENWKNSETEYYKRLERRNSLREKIKNLGGAPNIPVTPLEKSVGLTHESSN